MRSTSVYPIDYKCKDKNLASLEASLVPLDRSWLPLSENPFITPRQRTVQLGDAFEDTAFKPGFEIVKF